MQKYLQAWLYISNMNVHATSIPYDYVIYINVLVYIQIYNTIRCSHQLHELCRVVKMYHSIQASDVC